MTDLNAGLEFGFLSSLVNISFPAGGLITLELLVSCTDPDAEAIPGTTLFINSWSSSAPLPGTDPNPNAFFAMSTLAHPIGSSVPQVQPGEVSTVAAVSDFGGVGGNYGRGLLLELSGKQTFPVGLLKAAAAWPQPYGMWPQNGVIPPDIGDPTGPQIGAYFLSLGALKLPFTTNFTIAYQGTLTTGQSFVSELVVSYYKTAPTSFDVSAGFPLLVPATPPTDQKIYSLPGGLHVAATLQVTLSVQNNQLSLDVVQS